MRAFITGITGQDGAYLSRLLLEKGYEVVGLIRPGSRKDITLSGLRWLGIANSVRLVEGDLTDLACLMGLLGELRPAEIYNLAAQSVVSASWRQPIQTAQITGIGALNLLEAMRLAAPDARFYQASSSEMYGLSSAPRQTEASPFHPRSPYAVAKAFAHWTAVNHRESFGLHVSCGILFNHASPLRGVEFLTRKLTDGVARIKLGRQRELRLGDLDVERDWGHARDHVQAMHLMVRQAKPDDYVVATGRTTSVRELCRIAFAQAGLVAEDHVVSDPALRRPADFPSLCGDAGKAKKNLGWEATTTVEDLLAEMIDADLHRVSREAA